jgi:hypothetical protein
MVDPCPVGVQQTDLSEMVGGSDAFGASRSQLERIVDWLSASDADALEHSDLEARINTDGRELLRLLLQDHLDLRAGREQRLAGVRDEHHITRRTVECEHRRVLGSVFGEVTVSRMAYRQRGCQNRYVADGVLNLPVEQASHGVRRLVAIESAAGSFDRATCQIRERTGLGLGKRQVEQLAVLAAGDFDAFYRQMSRTPEDSGNDDHNEADVLVLSADAKGIVMRPDALRELTARAAERASPKLRTRLSRGEKANRKRMAEIGAVYDISPTARTAADVLAPTAEKTQAAPRARHKWLCASVIENAATVISQIFDEAERRDPEHQRTWVALVDGNAHQINRIRTEAKQRNVTIAVIIDFVHVLEYLWTAAWCFFTEGNPAAETWVKTKALAVLEGNAGIVAAAIRRTATKRNLPAEKRLGADRAARYLINKKPYLDYPNALANGWPIGTGIIEGACRHLVKDRMDITGARWGLHGAEAVLKLRALTANGDLDTYWDYHLTQERHRNHDLRYANSMIPHTT